MLVIPCPHCGWWGFAHADELGPRDAARALARHLRSSHPIQLPPVWREKAQSPRKR